ncbi:MAG: helix-turn-helix transcriptional regulator, partial [Methylobacteriaceae bacterium]|nr:helix-turn-helix transcriptional regulator [Methylobacteriaceae bacterium]
MKKAPNEVDRQVGARVRMRRMMSGMSQEKLGEGLGLTFQRVQKYEKGANQVGAGRFLSRIRRNSSGATVDTIDGMAIVGCDAILRL